jgi:hypothetical protein
MAQQVKTITSETLEAAYRALTPSQNGFTEDLMASNTIIPVLDLTSAAEGSSVPEYLQNALAFGSQTAFNVINTTTTLANSTGFWRVFGTTTARAGGSGFATCKFTLTDGVSPIDFWIHSNPAGISSTLQFDFVVFLSSGISLTTSTDTVNSNSSGSYRQIADVNGTLVNPSGFTPQ